MGLFNLFRGQFIDVIEYPNENPAVLVHRFERFNNEIKYGAKLIVRPGQAAVFVNEGKIADKFGPGTYTLETKNLPILTTLLSLPYNFNSPFKAEVYFIRTTEQLDRTWGTATPVMMRDADFGIVRLRARGNYAYKVSLRDELLTRFVGAQADFTGDAIEGQMKTKVVSACSDALGELKIPALDLAANYTEIGDRVKANLEPDFAALGFELLSFTVESISLPDEVNQAMDKRSSLGALGGVMDQYTRMQAADAMRAAADNPGGAGNMTGMFVGANLGGAINASVQPPQPAPQAVPPPLPAAPAYFAAINGASTGPYTQEQLKAAVLAGQVKADTLVWAQGMSGWQAAGTVPALAPVFAAMPPPLP